MENLWRPHRREDTRRAYAVSSPPQEAGSSEPVSCDRLRLFQDRRLPYADRPHIASALLCPSALSLEFRAPAPPVSTLTTSDCLAGPSPDSRADFRHRALRLLLRPLSQTSGIEALRRPCEAPETNPAPEALPALSMLFVSLFTSLSGITRRDCGRVRGSSEPALFASRMIAPARRYRSRRFRGIEWRSVPLPLGQSRSQFGIVSSKTHWQARCIQRRASHG